jgi:uncharacterized protein (DUF2225 family)
MAVEVQENKRETGPFDSFFKSQATAVMIVWSTVETSCPMCQRRLRVREVGGCFSVGQDTDLMLRMKGKHIIQAEIHTCQGCHFSGYAHDFTLRSVTGSMVKRFFEIRPIQEAPLDTGQRKPETPLPHQQYHWAALSAPAIGLTPTDAGLRFVRAYWCLRLPPSSMLPAPALKKLRKRYLREAISRLRQGLRFEKKRSLVFLIGELCRRNGNFLLACQYFERFLTREKGPRYLKLATMKLLVAARMGDAGDKTMEELLYDQEFSPPRAPPEGG